MPGLSRRDSLHFAYRLLQDLNVLLVNSVLALERTTRRKAKIIEMAAIVETMPKSKTKSKRHEKKIKILSLPKYDLVGQLAAIPIAYAKRRSLVELSPVSGEPDETGRFLKWSKLNLAGFQKHTTRHRRNGDHSRALESFTSWCLM